MHFRGFPGVFEHRAPPYVPYISVDFARFLGTEVPPGYHTLAEMYERGGGYVGSVKGGGLMETCCVMHRLGWILAEILNHSRSNGRLHQHSDPLNSIPGGETSSLLD